ncbi:hypothetical protein CLIM01_07356 [Colletotrichum limetticola]|uniref:Uncharacterized protein n=1 Tax=Colletotrichum limetticola TaxID=1209924 RepID=A0ABQ9PUQ9_9PEZI|nr:hypothetical protein CLIM01_07356 [Colletotrichum limetticola]
MNQHDVDVIPIYKATNSGTTLDSGNTRSITAQSPLSAQCFDEYSCIFGSTVFAGGGIKSIPGSHNDRSDIGSFGKFYGKSPDSSPHAMDNDRIA